VNKPRIQIQEVKEDVYGAMRAIGIIGVLQELRSCCLATVSGCDEVVQGYYASVSRVLAEAAAEVTRLSDESKQDTTVKKTLAAAG
jgi:hypothetical protein